MPRFLGHGPELNGQVFDLNEAKITIGRTPDNKIHIPDNSVSSHHAELLLEGNDYTIKDLDSTNGSRVNGEKIQTANLKRGDLVRIGNIELLYESETDPVLVPLPPVSHTIPLDQSASHGRPPHFAPTAPINRGQDKDTVPWKPILIGAFVLAAGGIGWFLFSLFNNGN